MSKLKLLSSVAVAAMLAMPAFAQTSSPTSPSSSRPSTTAPNGAASSRSTLPSDISAAKVSDLVGKNVYNTNNEKVGDINEIVVPKSGGGEAMAVIGVGGFLGIGEKEAAVPLNQLKVQDDKIVGAGLTKDSLKQHAEFKKDNYTKLDRNQVVGQASGVTRSSPSGSSSSSSSSGMSHSGSGAAGSTGSSTSPSGSSTMGSSSGSSSMGSPNPAATTNPPDNSTATKKQ